MDEILLGLAAYGYIGLFVASFLSATILPFSSELVFTTLLYTTPGNVWIYIAAATLGNSLGALTCYALGRLGKLAWIERYLKISREKIDHWNQKLREHATWACFFTFLPLVGDIIAVCAGFLRTPLWSTILFFTLGKFFRYLLWISATYWLFV